MWRFTKVIGGLVALVAVAALVVGYVGFTKVEVTDPEITGVSLAVTDSALKRLEAAGKFALGDYLGAAEAMEIGLKVDLQTEIVNPSSFPTFVTSASARVVLNGEPVIGKSDVSGGFIGSNDAALTHMSVTIPFDQIPGPLVRGLLEDGAIDIALETKVRYLFFERTETSQLIEVSVVDSLRSILPGL